MGIASEYRNLPKCREWLKWVKKKEIGIETEKENIRLVAIVLIAPSVD